MVQHDAIEPNRSYSTGNFRKESYKLVLPGLEVAETQFLQMLQIVGTSHCIEGKVR